MKDDFKIILLDHVNKSRGVTLDFVSYDTQKFEDTERVDGKFPIRIQLGVELSMDDSIDSCIDKIQTVKMQIAEAHRSCRQALEEGQTIDQWRIHHFPKLIK